MGASAVGWAPQRLDGRETKPVTSGDYLRVD